MPANYVLIQETTLNASAASVTFSSIPQTGYTDLKVVWSARSARTGVNTDDMVVGFNGVNTNLSGRILWGTGSAAASLTDTQVLVGEYPTATATSNTFANCEIYIPNYTSANNKSFSADTVGENNATLAYATLTAGLWSSTAAITSITLKTGSGSNLVAGSTFSLYGIAAVGTTPTVAPKASGGDVITNNGTYWFHTFYSSGTFVPNTSLSCDYLVVAGGGGGGGQGGGGGGAGGLRSTVGATGGGGSLESALALSASTNYTVTIGAGGSGGASGSDNGTAGGSSVFASITSIGGGQGGFGTAASNGKTGGSGGGGAGQVAPATTGGTGTANQGYAGGASTATANYGAGGGGGAGAVGAAGTGSASGAGGAGVTTSISGTSTAYAGGGGGGLTYSGATAGAGGTGGGGAGGGAANGTAGTVNLGGGGGAGGHNSGTGIAYAGANGGSGVVIIRYAM